MAVDMFFTLQTGQVPGGTASAGSKGAGDKDAAALNGLAFFDAFLANLEQTLDQNLKTGATDGKSQSLDKDAEAALLKALANSEYTREELSRMENPSVADVLALNQQINDEALKPIELPGTQGITSVLESIILTTEADFRPALNNLQRILQKINALLEQESPVLINTNLSAQQVTALQEKVDAVLKGHENSGTIDQEEFSEIFVGLIKILPPESRPDVVVTEQAIIFSTVPLQIEGGKSIKPANDGNGKMNDLLQQAAVPALSQNAAGQNSGADLQGRQQGQQSFPQGQIVADAEAGLTNADPALMPEDGAIDGDTDFASLLKAAGGKDGSAALQGGGSDMAADKILKTLPDLSVLQNLPFAASGAVFADMEFSPAMMEEMGLALSSFTSVSQGATTALVTQSHHAALPHPGVNVVAAHIQKAAGTGQPSNITLQLDPPELGRVEVKMSFGKDSKIKAVLTVEKPETLHMLQRDAHALERSLQEAGLDSESGLSFELAQHDHPFSQDGGHDGSRHGSGGGDAEAEDEGLELTSTMTWQVDAATGHMRYNILA